RPLTSTPFPYTTLFRSHCRLPGESAGPAEPSAAPPQPGAFQPYLPAAADHGSPAVPVCSLRRGIADPGADFRLRISGQHVLPGRGPQDPAVMPGLGGVRHPAVGPTR